MSPSKTQVYQTILKNILVILGIDILKKLE